MQPSEIPSYPVSASTSTMNNPQDPALSVGAGEAQTFRPVPLDHNAWQHMTRTVEHYERLEQIGEGTYGQVYRARCRDSGRIVALKKMRIHHGGYWGMPLQFIREIKILKRLQHPNLLQMIEVVTSKSAEHLDQDDPRGESFKVKDKAEDTREAYKGNLFLVLEYVDHDLTGLLDIAYQFTPVQIKCIFKQLLEALAFMHQNKYVHRDIKSSNLLLDSNFCLKLADFGLARSIQPPLFDQVQERKLTLSSGNDFTNKVITLWYRPPEILLGAVQYGTAVDIWSAGCILAELILGKPLFVAKTELDQLNLILEMIGPPPSNATYDFFESGMKKETSKVPLSLSRAQTPPAKLRPKYGEKLGPAALSLIEKMLAWDPRQRISAENALGHRYFWTEPVAPANPAELRETLQLDGPNGHFHEFQTKKKRKEAKALADEAKEMARIQGKTEAEAQALHKQTYRDLMKKVYDEGLGTKNSSEKPPPTIHDLSRRNEPDERRQRRSGHDQRTDEDSRRRERRDGKEERSRRRSGDESRGLDETYMGRKRRREDHEERRQSDGTSARRSRDDGDAQLRSRKLPSDNINLSNDASAYEMTDARVDAGALDSGFNERPYESTPPSNREERLSVAGDDSHGYLQGNDPFPGNVGLTDDLTARGENPSPDPVKGTRRVRDRPPYEDFDRSNFPERGHPYHSGGRGRGRGRNAERPAYVDGGGHFEGRGRGRPFTDAPGGRGSGWSRPGYDDRDPSGGRGRGRPYFESQGSRVGQDWQRVGQSIGGRGRHNVGPPFKRRGADKGPPLDGGFSADSLYYGEPEGRFGPRDGYRDREANRSRPEENPPQFERGHISMYQSTRQSGDTDRGRRGPPRADLNMYGPSGSAEQERYRRGYDGPQNAGPREQNYPCESQARPDRADRRHSEKRRKKERKRSERSRSRDRHGNDRDRSSRLRSNNEPAALHNAPRGDSDRLAREERSRHRDQHDRNRHRRL